MISEVLTEILIFLINVTGITLIITVLTSDVDKVIKRIFTAMTLLMFIWVDFAYFARIEEQSQYSLISIRIAWVVTPILCVLIYSFIIRFLNITSKYRILSALLYILVITVGFLTLATDLIISDIFFRDGILKILYGNFAPIYFLFILSFVVISFYLLINKYRDKNLSKEERPRVVFLLLGLAIFFIMNSIFNLALPAFFDIVHLYEFGDYSTAVFLVLVAISTLRHNFFGGKVVLATFLVSFLGSYLFVDTFVFTDDPGQRIVDLMILVLLYLPLGVILIRSVLNEIKQKEELQELSRQQEDIIDVFGHELKTPFTAIKQEVTYLLEIFVGTVKDKLLKGEIEEKDASELLEGLETINIASDQGIEETSTMVETARLDKAKFSLNYSEFDLVQAVKDTYRLINKQLDPDIYEVTFDFEGEKLEVEADKVRIQEAISGLFTNARKYGVNPQTKRSKIKISVSQRDGFAFVVVKDNGIGIAQSDLKELGKKFKRLDDQTDGGLKRPGGTGLGLFVIKGMMDRHAGEMIIESDGLGKGSTFTLKFPIKKVEGWWKTE